MDSRAFRECEGDGFQLVINTAMNIARKHKGALFKASELLPSAVTVSAHVTKQADSLRKVTIPKIKEILTTVGGCICLDGWSEDYTKTKYIGYTVHYIRDGVLEEELLSISEYDEQKSGSGELTTMSILLSEFRKFTDYLFYF